MAVPIVSVDIFPPSTVGADEEVPGAVGVVQRHRFAGRPQLIGDMFAEQERRGPQLIGDMFADTHIGVTPGGYAG